MSFAAQVDAIAKVPIFANLSRRQVRKLLKETVENRFEQGTVIVREGSPGETMFVIVEGTARVLRNGRTVRRVSAGDFFGEICVIDRSRRSATVIAETPVSCVVLYREDLKRIVSEEPEAAWAMLESLASRMRER